MANLEATRLSRNQTDLVRRDPELTRRLLGGARARADLTERFGVLRNLAVRNPQFDQLFRVLNAGGEGYSW